MRIIRSPKGLVQIPPAAASVRTLGGKSVAKMQSSRAEMRAGTAPEAIFDLKSFSLRPKTRPDGGTVLIDFKGAVVVPETLSPGGIELPPLILPGKALKLVAFGDSGTGKEAQRAIARPIVQMAQERGVNYGVHLGDIFYPHGITSVRDPQIHQSYIDCYGSLPEMHAILGNHDYGSSSGAGVPEAIIEVANSGRQGFFKMPQRYYSRRILVDGLTIRTLYLDTSVLAVDPNQLKWIRKELAKESDYTIVFGHHAIHNCGWHGGSKVLKKLLLPLLDARADLYVGGHEHNQQQLRTDKGLPLVISGAAVESRPTWLYKRGEFSSMRRGAAFFTVSREGITYEALSAHKQATMFANTFHKRERRLMPYTLPR